MEQENWGKFVAVSLDGRVLLGEEELTVFQEALRDFGGGNFVMMRVGLKVVGKNPRIGDRRTAMLRCEGGKAKMTVTVVDYGVGNLRSVVKALESLGCQVRLTSDPDEVAEADKLVLPGVGAFGAGMENLRRLGLVEAICDTVKRGRPLLGICLGLQLLFDESEEIGRHEGLKLVRGKVVRFPEQNGIRIPHMGWNALRIRKREPLFANVPDGAMVYFVHSYFPVPDDASVIAATTEHGIEFVSAIAIDNIFGTQFHPEKSSKIGLQILSNFVAL